MFQSGEHGFQINNESGYQLVAIEQNSYDMRNRMTEKENQLTLFRSIGFTDVTQQSEWLRIQRMHPIQQREYMRRAEMGMSPSEQKQYLRTFAMTPAQQKEYFVEVGMTSAEQKEYFVNATRAMTPTIRNSNPQGKSLREAPTVEALRSSEIMRKAGLNTNFQQNMVSAAYSESLELIYNQLEAQKDVNQKAAQTPRLTQNVPNWHQALWNSSADLAPERMPKRNLTAAKQAYESIVRSTVTMTTTTTSMSSLKYVRL